MNLTGLFLGGNLHYNLIKCYQNEFFKYNHNNWDWRINIIIDKKHKNKGEMTING